uniref:Uncharacterized protein n=1 Tax=Siphoviridae sp. ctprd3 TaxID=2827943 RepID=A0A8S5TAV3_9CAUD|nr:MAG TPA: hypothetical protein [Siphoviridae sp. ctprd3]
MQIIKYFLNQSYNTLNYLLFQQNLITFANTGESHHKKLNKNEDNRTRHNRHH